MEQNYDKLFEAIDNAGNLSDGELEALLSGLSEDEREMFGAMIATKRALQRNEAKNRADSVADEAWKVFEHRNFGAKRCDTDDVEARSETIQLKKAFFMPLRPIWMKIAASVASVLLMTGLTVAAVNGNWFNLESVAETEDAENIAEVTETAFVADTNVTTEVPQVEILDDVTLEEMMARIAAYYGSTVQFADDDLRNIRLHFEWDKSKTLECNIKLLNNFTKISVSIENGVIIVSNLEN